MINNDYYILNNSATIILLSVFTKSGTQPPGSVVVV